MSARSLGVAAGSTTREEEASRGARGAFPSHQRRKSISPPSSPPRRFPLGPANTIVRESEWAPKVSEDVLISRTEQSGDSPSGRRQRRKRPLSSESSSPARRQSGRRRQDQSQQSVIGCVEASAGVDMVLDGYSWKPPGLSETQVESWMRLLPEEKVPRLDSDGERYRELQLVYQLPKQDLDEAHCHHLGAAPECRAAFRDFAAARDDVALDVAVAAEVRPAAAAASTATAATRCAKCAAEVKPGSLAVMAPRVGVQSAWHPSCFTCSTCDELLVDLTYCVLDGRVFCERHYAERVRPRCGACDELIFTGEFTRALDRAWHRHHFVCWHCDVVLTGKRFAVPPAATASPDADGGAAATAAAAVDRPCCLDCYEKKFTHECQRCGKTIGVEDKDMAYKEMHWHESCFCCHKCGASLVEKPFAAKNAFIFCGSCYDSEFASRCDACGDTFRAGMKKMEYKNRRWHDTCFQCSVCKSTVGTKPFIIPNDKDIYCVACFEDKFATKCTKCKKVMTSGGVTFKNEAWHRECFTCAHCNCQLAGQKFASRNDKPYCAACFGDLFAKRCTACAKPITGTGGTRFISFEGRHWHSQCFVCALCAVSMAGKGFITDGEDIICPECAKVKLMGGGGGGAAATATSVATASNNGGTGA